MAAAATMEHNGVPIDVPLLAKLREKWGDIQDGLIANVDSKYGVFDGRTFKADRFADWLASTDIPWPRLDSGRLDLATIHSGRWLRRTGSVAIARASILALRT